MLQFIKLGIICIYNIIGMVLVKKDAKLRKAWQAHKSRAIITVCALNITCMAISFVCSPGILSLLCFAGVQTVSDELTSEVYSFPSWIAGAASLIAYILNGSFEWSSLFFLVGSITLFIAISHAGAFADGDVECVVPYLIASAALRSNPLDKAFVILIISSGTMTLEYIVRKIIKKEVPKNLPFMKNLFLGMIAASVSL